MLGNAAEDGGWSMKGSRSWLSQSRNWIRQSAL